MDSRTAYYGIYDFELLPYALGDVLTWNVQTTLRCLEQGRERVEVCICIDPRYPSSIYQRGLITAENNGLFFNELFGAFATHPLLGNIHLFSSRDDMLDHLAEIAAGDPVNTEVVDDYNRVLGQRDDADSLNAYFIKYIYSHAHINGFHEKNSHIPWLKASRGCEPDVRGLLQGPFAGRRVVIIHPRLRRLDNGLAGDHTYFRDSDFLEWFEFVRLAETRHPEVQFVVVGRLQEKPLELLRRPNVTTLRVLGLGLGHELTLMASADLFIGTSSGFAAMANFSQVPYFITHMNPESCNAYAIPNGSERLPFAAPNQFLVYERESTAMLMGLLERGIALPVRSKAETVARNAAIDVRSFERERSRWLVADASTSRFFTDSTYADQETAYLIWPKIQKGIEALAEGDASTASAIARRAGENFPRLQTTFPELKELASGNLPPAPRQAADRLRALILSRIDGTILPMWLRGTPVHRIGRHMKNFVLGYRRR